VEEKYKRKMANYQNQNEDEQPCTQPLTQLSEDEEVPQQPLTQGRGKLEYAKLWYCGPRPVDVFPRNADFCKGAIFLLFVHEK